MNGFRRMPGRIARRGAGGFTVLEILIAVTVFSVLFIAIMNFFTSSIRTFNLEQWRTLQKQQLSQKFALIRQDFDKAAYPSKVFAGGTVIFDGAAEPPDENTADKDPGDKYYVRYFEGKVSGDGAPNQKLLEWVMVKPIYDKSIEKFVSQETRDLAGTRAREVRCTLSLATDANGVPVLVYERTGQGSERFVVVTGVEEVEIEGKAVKPPGFQDYETASYKGSGEKKYNPWDDDGVINLTLRLSSKYTHGRKFGLLDPAAANKQSADMAVLEEKIALKSTVRIKSL